MAQQHLSLEELSSYLDGQVGGAQRLSLERHLDQCASCRTELAGLRATVVWLRRVPQAEPRRSFTLEPAYGQAGRLRPWLRWATGLAALLLVAVVSLDVLASLGAVSLAPSPPQETTRLAQVATPTPVAPDMGIARAPTDEAEAPQATPTPLPSPLTQAPEQPSFRALEVALLALVTLLGGLTLAQERRRRRI